jgi:hypothetical protein
METLVAPLPSASSIGCIPCGRGPEGPFSFCGTTRPLSSYFAVLLSLACPEMVNCTAVSERILVLGGQVDSKLKMTP